MCFEVVLKLIEKLKVEEISQFYIFLNNVKKKLNLLFIKSLTFLIKNVILFYKSSFFMV